MDREGLSQSEIHRNQINRGFQLIQSGERCEDAFGKPVTREVGDVFLAIGINLLKSTLLEASSCGVRLPKDAVATAKKLVTEKGDWAGQVIDNEMKLNTTFGIRSEFISSVTFLPASNEPTQSQN